MRRDETTDPEDLDRPKGNSLLENYEIHDHGEREFVKRAERADLTVEPWGIDMRHDDGDGLVYDDKLDFKLLKDDELVGLVDVKTKSSPKWMGQYNLRHFEKYLEQNEKHDVPTFVIMFQVNSDGEIEDEFVHRIWEHSEPLTSKNAKTVSTFPDGNHKLVVPHEERSSWTYLLSQVLFEEL